MNTSAESSMASPPDRMSGTEFERHVALTAADNHDVARTKGVLILTLSPRHQASRPAGRVSLFTPRVWLGPIIVAVALMYGLGLFYVGGTLNPGANLRHFPIAIVNQDTGMTGRLIADGLAANMDKNQFDIRVLPADQARDQLETGKVYAQVLLPWDLSQRLSALPQATLQPGQPLKPVITISTGPRAGAVAAAIADKAMRKALRSSTPGPAPCSPRNYDGKATAHRCREAP